MNLNDDKKKNGGALKKKTNRDRIHMKYSPLVERYLISHKYETMNNVREWKMLLTQRRSENQLNSQNPNQPAESKFERYKKIAEAAVEEMKRLSADHARNC